MRQQSHCIIYISFMSNSLRSSVILKLLQIRYKKYDFSALEHASLLKKIQFLLYIVQLALLKKKTQVS